MADEITVQLKEDLGVPDMGEVGVQDLPVAEIMTSSPEAYRAFVEGLRTRWVDRDSPGAVRLLGQATTLDPTFATAQYSLAQFSYISGNPAAAVAPLQAAMDHLYRIPERAQFQVKSDYYFIVRQDVDKALSAIEMWADIFPDDLAAYQARIQIETIRDDREGMLVSLQRILELDPAQRDVLLRMGEIHLAMGDLEAAREAFQSYADEFPNDHEVLTRLAGVSRMQGKLEESLDHYDRAQLLAPSDVGVMVGKGNVLRAMGDFSGAMEEFEDAMATAGTPEERAEVHGALEGFYRARGQMGKAVEHLEHRMEEVAVAQPELFATMIRLRQMPGTYLEAGMEAEALAVVQEARAQLTPPFDAFLPLGDFAIHMAKDDAAGIEATLPAIESIIVTFQNEVLRPLLVHAQGRVFELRGDYQAAMERYEEERRLNPSDATIPTHLGRCLREVGENGEAVTLFLESLKSSPWAPRTNYELALTYEAMGRVEEARTHLERALEVWAEADAGYGPAEEARVALERLGG
jgi:tetratricopeptide (TPR) repeat protein